MINTREYWKKYIFIVNGVDSMTRVLSVEQRKSTFLKEKEGRLYGPTIQQIIS